jgi:hypothetical protein
MQHVVAKAFEFRIDDRIRPVHRDHATVPAGSAKLPVMIERIQR